MNTAIKIPIKFLTNVKNFNTQQLRRFSTASCGSDLQNETKTTAVVYKKSSTHRKMEQK